MQKGLRERAKDKVLGPALPNEALAHERLGRPTALAVFSSDALSSTAYATEEILKTLLAAGIGVAAFTKVLPITVAMVAVLAILMFSYRQTIKAYPSAGGAYIVTKDNLGLLPAQVAGVALLTDYVLTVAVSVSAGTAALYSAVPSTHAYRVPIALVFIAIIALGNLRGVKESGKLFAAPTYGFVIAVLLIIVVGLVKAATGNLHQVPPADPGLLLGTKSISIFLLLHAFASGGAAMTGVEAISNGVPAFRPPEWKNARSTLMVMGGLLGVMFLGLSWLASQMHVVPTEQKTVISQIAKGVLGGGVPFFLVQLMTLLILVLAANTSFADFPRLASFHAEDAFMPRQLTKRGHRLGFSNGILFLAGAAAVLVVMFQASVDHLIPLYAIGVFTSFTLSQAGMAVRHLRLREDGWRLGLAINGGGAFATGLVTIIIAITKFTHGAWAVMLLVPIMVMVLVRLNHQYESEAEQLDAGVAEAIAAPVPASTMTVVMIDHLDTAAARALQVAKALRTDRTEAVHLAVDEQRATKLIERWNTIRPKHLDLRIVYCPDRKLQLGAQAYVGSLVDAGIHVNVIIPRLLHQRAWHRLLHDRTSESLAVALSKLPDVDVTFVPFHLGRHDSTDVAPDLAAPAAMGDDGATIGQLEPRKAATFQGQVRELALHTGAQTTSLVATVADPTGAVDLQFLGQTSLGGLRIGSRVIAKGTPAMRDGRLTVLNPVWEFTEPNSH
jgi:amino acid transporter